MVAKKGATMSNLPVLLALCIVLPALLWANRASRKRVTGRTATLGICVNMLLPFIAVLAMFRLRSPVISLPWEGFFLVLALGAWYFVSMMWVFGVKAPIEGQGRGR